MIPSWLQITASEVRKDSRLQPHQVQASGDYDEPTFDSEVTRRAVIQAGVVLRRLEDALAPLTAIGDTPTFEYSEAQIAAIREATKFKTIASLLGSLPDEMFEGPAKSARNDAEDILKGLESELKRLSAIALQRARSVGSTRIRSIGDDAGALDVPTLRARDIVNSNAFQRRDDPLPDIY